MNNDERLRKLMHRVKVFKANPDNFVIGDVIGLLDDLEEAMLYFCYVAEKSEQDLIGWLNGTRTAETEAAEREAWRQFEEDIINGDKNAR